MLKQYVTIFLAVLLVTACGEDKLPNPFDPNAPKPTEPGRRSASIGILGDTSDVSKATQLGIVVMGGGADVDAAFRWMIERSGGGDVVVIRASGTDVYNAYIRNLGEVNSVETLKIDSRKLADDEGVAKIIRNAEMLFIAGGDQSDYTNYWKGTKTMTAINYLLNEKKVPVGGTSAGAAILGDYYFSAERGGLESSDALANPYTARLTLGRSDFLRVPYLQNLIIDQHFSQRNREGRTVAFLGRIMKDWGKLPRAIAVDERTAVCIDEHGIAQVLSMNKAFFVKTDANKQPETLATNTPITWNREGKALEATAIDATVSGNRFNLNTFQPENTIGVTNYWWYVHTGIFGQVIRP